MKPKQTRIYSKILEFESSNVSNIFKFSNSNNRSLTVQELKYPNILKFRKELR